MLADKRAVFKRWPFKEAEILVFSIDMDNYLSYLNTYWILQSYSHKDLCYPTCTRLARNSAHDYYNSEHKDGLVAQTQRGV